MTGRPATLPLRACPHEIAVHPLVLDEDEDLAPRRSWPAPRPGMEALRGRVVELDGRALESYQKAGRETDTVVYFPGAPAVLPTDQILWRGKRYRITAPPRDPHGLGHYLKVECTTRIG